MNEETMNKFIRPGEEKLVEDNSVRNYFLIRAMDYIRENYKEKLTLKSVAEAVDISPWYLSRLINQYLDQSFTDVLNTIRINHSKNLLVNSTKPVKEIALEVGFANAAHFSRIFKIYAGMSASQFRKTNF